MLRTALQHKARILLLAIAVAGALAVLGGPGARDANAILWTTTVNVTGPGKGVVHGPGGFSCTKAGSAPVTCSYTYDSFLPDTKTFTAAPTGASSSFGGWSGACAGTGTCSILGGGTISAQFNLSILFDPELTLTGSDTVKILGAGTGSGSVTGPGINCTLTGGAPSGTCQKSFTVSILSPPETRTYTAVPAAGHTFAGWSGACAGAGATCSITGDGTATAQFDPPAGTPPAPPTPGAPPVEPATPAGGDQPQLSAQNTVDAELLDRWFKRTKRGKRLLRVELLAAEPVHVVLSLERRGRQLVSKEKRLKPGQRVLTLVVPKKVKKGRATLEISFVDGTSTLDLTKRVRIPRR